MEFRLLSGDTEEFLNIFDFLELMGFFGGSGIGDADLQVKLDGGRKINGVEIKNEEPFRTGGTVTTLSKCLK